VSLTFVVSTGRCGSTMLSHILHMHPDVLSASEFLTLVTEGNRSDAFQAPTMDGQQLWQRLSARYPDIDGLVSAGLGASEMAYPYHTGRFHPDTGVPLICHNLLPTLTNDPDALFDRLAAKVPDWPACPPADQYRAFLSYLAELLGRRVLVERSGGFLSLIPQLHQQYPDARFVHMYRDGPDTALSMSRHPAFRLAILLQKAAAAGGLPSTAPWQDIIAAAPKEYDGLLAAPFDKERFKTYPIPLTFFAWIWSTMVTEGAAGLAGLDRDTWISLPYERLVCDPRSELSRLGDFIGVPATPRWLDSAREFIDRSRTGSAAAGLAPGTLASLRAACERGTRAIAAVESGQPAPV
jgi:hypothetical protein